MAEILNKLRSNWSQRYEPFIGLATCFALAIFFTLTPFWWAAIIAGGAGGLFSKRTRYAILLGFVGTSLAWLIYAVYEITQNSALVLLDQLGGIIMGSSGMGTVVLLLVIIIGGILGLVGGLIGCGVRGIIESNKPTVAS